MFRILDGRSFFYQWDKDQQLEVMDYDITEVHFSTQVSEKALVCEVKQQDGKRVVDVPNILLQDTWDIKVYACCDCYTRGATIYEVKPKEKPEDYIYTETEVKTYDDLEKRIEEIENKSLTQDNLNEAISTYFEENQIEAGATAEQAAQIEANRVSIEEIERKQEDYALKTDMPTIEGLASEAYVNQQIEEIPETDLSNYYTKSETNTAINAAKPDLTPYAKKTDIPDTSGFIDNAELTTAVNTALAQAKASGEFDGAAGKDGTSATHSWNGTTLTITSASGTSSANLKGETGKDGTSVTVTKVSTSTADGGNNVVTFSDGKTLTVKNGSKGSAGTDATVTKESIEQALGYVPAGSGTETPLTGKKIVYDGDSICAAAFSYPKLIADKTACIYDNHAVGGARLCSNSERHSVVDNLPNLPTDGDIYCFQGGINDWWGNTPLGTYTQGDYTGELDTTTIYGAMEAICRYALTNFFGKSICFVITHKVQNAAYSKNTAGNTYWDYRKAIIDVCEKYSIPYYDAFTKCGLNGWHTGQKAGLFVNGDGTHPTEAAYEAYYVPQLIKLFESIIPLGDYEAPVKPVTYKNMLKLAVDSSGNPYNGGKGWKEDTYLSWNGLTESSSTNYDVTGWIPAKIGDVVRLKNMQLCKTVGTASKCIIATVKSDFSALTSTTNWLTSPSAFTDAWNVVTNEAGTDVVQFTIPTALSASLAYFRICAGAITDASIITVNEEID